MTGGKGAGMRLEYLKKPLAMLCRLALILVLIYAAGKFADGLSGNAGAESMESMELAIRRAAVSCYAAEGRYPDTLAYLVERYGVRLDPRYAVHYSVFAPNVPPEVDVVTKPSEEELWGLRH